MKISVVGPAKVGKTRFVNAIALHPSTSKVHSAYNPTVALRIVKHEMSIMGVSLDKKHKELVEKLTKLSQERSKFSPPRYEMHGHVWLFLRNSRELTAAR